MKIQDVTPDTEGTFLRCLHDEQPDDPRVVALRRRHYEARRASGLRAKVLVLDSGEVIGLYEHMGYSRVDTRGLAALVWKAFRATATPPRFLHRDALPAGAPGKVTVRAFLNGWCTGACAQVITARGAVAGPGGLIDYEE
ncbi:MAG: hypothetical protein ACE5EL_04185 [Anaerolineae bacterium]